MKTRVLSKAEADLISTSQSELSVINKHYFSIREFVEYKVINITPIKVQDTENDYQVIITLEKVPSIVPNSIPVDYFDFKRNYPRMNYEYKLIMLRNQAFLKFNQFKEEDERFRFFTANTNNVANEVYQDFRQHFYEEWQIAENELSNLITLTKKENIDLKKEWVF